MRTRPLLATVAVAALALGALTSCSASKSSPAASQTVDPAKLTSVLPAATKSVNTVTWGLAEGEPRSLDPLAGGNFVVNNLCDDLLTLEPDFSVKPGLATSATFTDPVTFVIDLRKDVTFWDGSPLTADDVVWSLSRNLKPTSPWFGTFALVKGIEKTGDHQVTVHFNAPDSAFHDALSGLSGAVLSKAYGEKAGADLGTAKGGIMCTGPYELGTWTPGKGITTTANAKYWNGAPLVKHLDYVFVPDGTTLTNALLAGEIDGAFNVSSASRDAFTKSSTGRLVVGPTTASFSFGPTASTGPAANPKIRQALSLAIDRKTIVDTVLKGLGTTQKTFTPPFVWNGLAAAADYQKAYDALPDAKVDLAKAKQLVTDSGVDTTKPIVFAVPAGSKELGQIAAIIQAAAAQIGLKATIDELQPADYTGIFFDPTKRQGIDFVVATGFLDTPGVLTYAQQFLLDPKQAGYYNWSGYSNPTVTADLQTARTTLDPAKSAAAYIAAQQVFAPDQLQVTLASAYQTTYLKKGLTGVVTSIAAVSSPWGLHLGAE